MIDFDGVLVLDEHHHQHIAPEVKPYLAGFEPPGT